jgi:hypothetical protein
VWLKKKMGGRANLGVVLGLGPGDGGVKGDLPDVDVVVGVLGLAEGGHLVGVGAVHPALDQQTRVERWRYKGRPQVLYSFVGWT